MAGYILLSLIPIWAAMSLVMLVVIANNYRRGGTE